ncbi:MAG: nuclear transport factor 2 family protein [Pyrinomonadaceae bacterium]
MRPVGLIIIFILSSWSHSYAQISTHPQVDGPVAQHLSDLERKWDDALLVRDIKTLGELLSEDFAISGTTFNKKAYLDLIKSISFEAEISHKSNLQVRIYGDTAVVFGRHKFEFITRGPNPRLDFAFMDVWVKEKDKWRCVATAADTLSTLLFTLNRR